MPRKKAETLMLKFRLRVTHRMPKSEAVSKLHQAIRTGFVPEGIEIAYMDWAKGKEGRVREGQIDGDLLLDMRQFYGAMRESQTRAERTD